MTVEDEVGGATRTLPIHSKGEIESFDIVEVYNQLLTQDADITMPIAAIEALIEALSHSKSSTISETIDLVKTQSAKLRAGVENHTALTHGTDFFQSYLVRILRQGPGTESFDVMRQHLLKNSRLFVQRAKAQRESIATVAREYIKDGQLILTHGDSRVVQTLLCRAKERQPKKPPKKFKVVYVVNDARRAQSKAGIDALRRSNISVAVIPESAVAYCMNSVDSVIVGAEAVTGDGGIISRMGTSQLAQLAKTFKKNFYVAAEQHKFGQTMPGRLTDVGFDQEVMNFKKAEEVEGDPDKSIDDSLATTFVDYTVPELITSFFCNHGIKTPSAIAKEVIDAYF